MRLKRIGAFFIDIFIIVLISNLLSGFLPNHDKINEVASKSTTIMQNYMDAFSNQSADLEKYVNELNDYNYELAKVSVTSNLLSVFLYLLYFGVFQRYNNGQTVGKSLFKLEVVSIDGKELTIKQMLIRGIILFSVITNLLDIIVISVFNQSVYDSLTTLIMLLELGVMLGCVIPVLLNKTGFHEILSKTSVVVVGSQEKDEGKVTKWKKTAEKEQNVRKYRVNHTSGKRRE